MNVSGKAIMILSLAVAVLVFPIAAMADNTSSNAITWFDTDASTSVSAGAGLSLTTAITRVTLANGDTLPQGGSYGSLSLSTGSLLSGSLATGCLASNGGCSFSFADSSFKISGNGGAPSWSGEITPNTNVTLAGTCTRGTCTYGITAELSSSSGQPVGYTILGFTTNGKFTGASVTTSRAGGLTNVTVPEPGTLGLLGVGLFCLAGVLRRKLVRS
jgi:PEP-CTERM motif